jgi:MMP 1-O-methyltransferase
MHDLAEILQASGRVPGWTRNAEAAELSRISFSLPNNCVIIEVGSFLGSGTILLAGPRKLRGSGQVHCIDPFDCSGDSFSVPHYTSIVSEFGGRSTRALFETNIRDAGLSDWVRVHQGRAAEIASKWTVPIDMLFLDGDHSRLGAYEAYQSWAPFLKPGGVIALHNSQPGRHEPDHDGHLCVVVGEIRGPDYSNIRLIDTTTFAEKRGGLPGW